MYYIKFMHLLQLVFAGPYVLKNILASDLDNIQLYF